jgi:hypothetical protein
MRYILTILLLFTLVKGLNSQTFGFYRTSPEMIYSADTFGVISHGKIINISGDTNTIRIIRTEINAPQGWNSCICDIWQCHPPGMDTAIADYPPGMSNLDIMIYAHSIPGKGYITYRAESVSNPAENYTVIFGGAYVPSAIQQLSAEVKGFSLKQNYPNPFNPSTQINFSIPAKDFVTLKIYSSIGKEVLTLVNNHLAAGEYRAVFNGETFASGMYYYILRTGEYTSVKKMMLVK